MQGLGKHSNIQTNTCNKHTYHHTQANIQTNQENKNMGEGKLTKEGEEREERGLPNPWGSKGELHKLLEED